MSDSNKTSERGSRGTGPIDLSGVNITRRRILLAEKDPASRRLISWTLRVDGYVVDDLSSAAELCAADLSSYDLIIASTEILDAAILDAARLDYTRIVASGRSLIVMNPSPSESCAGRYRAATCIHKPIYVDELRGAVTACISAAPAADTGELSAPIALDAGLEATV
ncbi:MAG: response regulator [Myxococcales bacterium]|nr:response regulator [Myxococcales bacterium]